MRLGLSSSAAPELALAELAAACGRRGLAALELVSGDAHGVSPGSPVGTLPEDVEVVAFRASGSREVRSAAAARLSAELGAPV
ncbi:MAG TPA: hypothetical protein VFQ76_05560, partial [Longimicrobiaceae bacterium]|nr:hypothetical protein [Longimicrobiaceae bacterium]